MTQSEIDAFNERLRANPDYQQFLAGLGVDISRPIKLSDDQREQAKHWLRQQGIALPGNLEIDTAANVNQNEGVGKWARDWRTYAAIGAGVTGLGALGVGPLAGALGGAGSAAGAAGASAGASGAATGAAGAVGAGVSTANVAREMIQRFGAGAAGAADAMAANRGTQFDARLASGALAQQAERDYNAASIAREQAGREKDRNAWEMMNRASYVVNAPANINKTMLSPYSRSLAGPDAFVREQAAKYGNRSAIELDEGNTLPVPQRVAADIDLADPSALEKIAGIGAGVAGVASAIPWWKKIGGWIR
jgi:hypothetical protein